MLQINLNQEFCDKLNEIMKNRPTEYPNAEKFVEKKILQELNQTKEELKSVQKAQKLFHLIAQQKFSEVEKLFPGSQKKR